MFTQVAAAAEIHLFHHIPHTLHRLNTPLPSYLTNYKGGEISIFIQLKNPQGKLCKALFYLNVELAFMDVVLFKLQKGVRGSNPSGS